METGDSKPSTSAGKGPARIFQLKITLNYIDPPIWRRVNVAEDTNLRILHRILQIVMGWENYHLHAFLIGGMSYAPHEDYLEDEDDHEDETKFVLRDIAPEVGCSFHYQYDLGCGWMHEVIVQKIVEPTEGDLVPKCVEGVRACPPEDVRGLGGYDRFLETIQDPSNPEHEKYKKWIGYDFNPEKFDVDKVNKALKKIDMDPFSDRWF